MANTSYDDQAKTVIGDSVRRLREESGRPVVELAGEIGMVRGYWYEIERGSANATIETLQKIADLFGLTVRDLLTPPRNGRKRREPVGARR